MYIKVLGFLFYILFDLSAIHVSLIVLLLIVFNFIDILFGIVFSEAPFNSITL